MSRIIVSQNPRLSPEFHCPKGAGGPGRPPGGRSRQPGGLGDALPGARRGRGPLRGGDAEDRPAPRPLRRLLSSRATATTASRTCLRRDVLAWQQALVEQGLAPATVNNHLASLSAFTTWVAAQAPTVFPVGDPAKGIRELGLPPLEPRALTPAQVRSLKNLCDRLERFHRLKGQRWANGAAAAPVRAHGRPWRDRAIVYVFLSTGLAAGGAAQPRTWTSSCRNTVAGLRQARQGRLTGVQGQGRHRADGLPLGRRPPGAGRLPGEGAAARRRRGDAGALPDARRGSRRARPTGGSRCGRST